MSNDFPFASSAPASISVSAETTAPQTIQPLEQAQNPLPGRLGSGVVTSVPILFARSGSEAETSRAVSTATTAPQPMDTTDEQQNPLSAEVAAFTESRPTASQNANAQHVEQPRNTSPSRFGNDTITTTTSSETPPSSSVTQRGNASSSTSSASPAQVTTNANGGVQTHPSQSAQGVQEPENRPSAKSEK
ncbi:hypothetical protein HK102_000117, partial [Quaeritorhiza haematococci]